MHVYDALQKATALHRATSQDPSLDNTAQASSIFSRKYSHPISPWHVCWIRKAVVAIKRYFIVKQNYTGTIMN